MRQFLMTSAVMVLLALAPPFTYDAVAATTIAITVTDAAGEGFNDPSAFTPIGGNNATTLGEARRLAFRYALDIIAGCIESPVVIEIEASFDPLACSTSGAVLGYGTSKTVHRDFINAPLPLTYYPAALANALAGVDLEPTDADMEMAFNSDLGAAGCLPTKPWYYGLDGNTLDTDFVTVVLHEICHGLGFRTYMNTTAGTKFMGLDDRYLTYLENHFTVPAAYPLMSDAQRAASNTNDPNLHWTGPSVTAAWPGLLVGGFSNGHVRMHGPAPLVPGSSVHHFSNALSPSELMEANMTGDNHDLGLAINLLDDLGWTVCNTTAAAACSDGAVLELASPTGPAPYLTGGPGLSNTEWGLYITANRAIQVCALGIRIKNEVGQTITATVYGANGTARGGVLATGALTITQSALQFQYVPINVVLQPCESYEIAVTVGDVSEFYYWDKSALPLLPFDTANGAVRVRESSYYGSTSSIPYVFEFALIGTDTPSAGLVINDPAITWSTCADLVATPRGLYLHANETARLSSVALETTFGFSDFGRILRANVYEAQGTTRQQLVATGTRKITSFGSTGFTEIPVIALLREGFDYDVEVEFPATSWTCGHVGPIPGPFTNGPFTILDGESGGLSTAPLMGRFQFQYSPGVADNQYDLVKPFHGPPAGSWNLAPVEVGINLLALRDLDLYSLGWRGDVSKDWLLVAQVYEAPGGFRGPLLADGYIESGEAGMRWHDIPIDMHLVAGVEYDVAIIISQSNNWEYWHDTSATVVPYNAHGYFTVLGGEQGGNPAATELPHFRVGACPSRMATVDVEQGMAPAFALTSWPNPVSGTTTIRYSLRAAEPVTMAVYDVRGRRVQTLVQSAQLAAGPHQVTFDTSGIAAGVYFVRVQTAGKQLTHKLVVMR